MYKAKRSSSCKGNSFYRRNYYRFFFRGKFRMCFQLYPNLCIISLWLMKTNISHTVELFYIFPRNTGIVVKYFYVGEFHLHVVGDESSPSSRICCSLGLVRHVYLNETQTFKRQCIATRVMRKYRSAPES